MKRLYYVIASLALLLAGCTHEEKVFELQCDDGGIKSFTSFTATLDDVAGTRAYLDGTSSNGVRRVHWDQGDAISVYSDTNTKLKEFVLTSLDGDKATFTGEKVTGKKFYAVYAPFTELAVDEKNPEVVRLKDVVTTVSEPEFTIPMVAVSTDGSFAFKQTMGIVHVTVGNVHQLGKVTFRGNSGEKIGDSGYIDFSDEKPSFKLDANANIEGDSQVFGLTEHIGKYSDIYYAIPPMVFENGFKIEIMGVDADGNEFEIYKSHNSRFEVKSSNISSFTLVDISAELEAQVNEEIIVFADPIAKQICVENWDTNGDGELSYAEAAAVTDIGTLFLNDTESIDPNASTITKDMVSFNEFQYFTGVTELKVAAFNSCRKLESITLPNSLTAIGNNAFTACSALEEIDIPEGVKSIGQRAFSMTSLKRLHIPASLVSFGRNPIDFYALDEITVDSKNPVYDSRENCNAIIETATNTLLYGCNNTTIPSSVTRIGDSALFACSGFTNDNLDLSNVTSVGASAFAGTGITGTLNIPATLVEIGSEAFGASFTSITVALGNPVFDSRNNCNAVIETATNTLVIGCAATQIPIDIKAFGYGAFSSVKGLGHVDIPAFVTDLGERTFANSDIKSVSIPEGITTIPTSMFHLCEELETVSLPSTLKEIGMMAFNQNHKLKNISFPEGLTRIGDYAFTQCFAIETIDLPSTLESIGSICFDGCSAATTIILRAATPPTVTFAPLPSWPYDIPIYIPEESIDSYKSTAIWSNYLDRYEPLSSYSPDLTGTVEVFENEDKHWDN